MRLLYLILILLLVSFPLLAQGNSASLAGRVLDSDLKPAGFATVVLYALPDSSLTKAGHANGDGSFELQGIDKGRYFLRVSYVGFEPYESQEIVLEGGEIKSLPVISLKPVSQQLEAVVVTGRKPLVEVKPGKTVFNVENSINSAGSDALELLRKAPGVIVDNNDNVLLSGKSGVRIYIDGKPSPLRAGDLTEFLQSMRSEEIAAIEIITNPSSKYEAEGNAGIIDIRLKRDRRLGTNIHSTLGYSLGIHPKYNMSGNFNYRNKEVNIYGNYGLNYGDYQNYVNISRNNSGNAFDIASTFLRNSTNHNFRLGTDWFVGENSTLGLLAHGYFNRGENSNNSRNLIYLNGASEPTSILRAFNEREGSRDNMNFNLNYATGWKDGQSLNIDLDYGYYKNQGDSYQPNYYYDATEEIVIEERIFAANTPTEIDIYTFKTDYEQEALGGTLAAGVKLSSVVSDNSYNFYDVINGQYNLNADRTNRFDYRENVNAAYVNYSLSVGDWNLQGGLRLENTESEGDLTSDKPTDNENVKRSYTDLFPSGGITYKLSDKHSFRLNYSRRIDRPNYQDLNPFEFKLDELSFRKGNAFLNPQYTNNIELTHTFNYSLNTTLSYSRTTDYIANLTDTLSQTASYITLRNLAEQEVISLNISYPFSPADWWSVYANVTGFYLQNKAKFDEGKVIDISTNTLNLYAQNTFQLPAGFRLEVSGFYQSPSVWGGNFKTDALWSIGAGLQKKVLNGRGTIKVAVSDIFESTHWTGRNSFGALAITANGGHESRRLNTTFSYSFGNEEVKASRKRKTGLEEENSRLQSSN